MNPGTNAAHSGIAKWPGYGYVVTVNQQRVKPYDATEPLNPPGKMSAIWTVEPGCFEMVLCDPYFRAYMAHDVDVLLIFESKRDATKCLQRFSDKTPTPSDDGV